MKHISILDIFYTLKERWKIIIISMIIFILIGIIIIITSKPIYKPTAIVKVDVYEVIPKIGQEVLYKGLLPSVPFDKVGSQVEIIKIISGEVLKDNGVNLKFNVPNSIKVDMKKTIIDTIKKNLVFDLKIKDDSISVFDKKILICSGTFNQQINCPLFSFELKKLKSINKQITGKIIYENYPKTIENWMKNKVSINQEGITDLIKISVEDEDKLLAVKIANDIANRYIDWSLEQERRVAKLSKVQLEKLLDEINKQLDSLKQLQSKVRLDSLTLVSYLLEFRSGLSSEALAEIIKKLISNPNDNYLRRIIERYYSKDIDYAIFNSQVVSNLSRRDSIISSIIGAEIAIAKTVSPAYVVAYASEPYKPIWPNKRQIIIFSLFIGLIFGAIFSITYDFIDRKISTILQLKRWTHLENVNFFYNLNELKTYLIINKSKKFHFNYPIEGFENYQRDISNEYVIIINKGLDIYNYIEIQNFYSDKKCNILIL
ncbi:MAG: Wzz/FepE/Etk N-terminal domain-containing protein [candidate division WOR-3 bacterium]